MMTKTEANRLSKIITRTSPHCRIDGLRKWGGDGYELDVVDTTTGVPFVVSDRGEWLDRLTDVAAYGDRHAAAAILAAAAADAEEERRTGSLHDLAARLRDESIRRAVNTGHTRAEVARATGLSRERVGQIVDGRR